MQYNRVMRMLTSCWQNGDRNSYTPAHVDGWGEKCVALKIAIRETAPQ